MIEICDLLILFTLTLRYIGYYGGIGIPRLVAKVGERQ